MYKTPSLIRIGSRPCVVYIVRRVMGDCEWRRVYYIYVHNFNNAEVCWWKRPNTQRTERIL